jgi:hypothetical protein
MSFESQELYKCTYCKKTKKYKVNWQKHVLLCEYRKTTPPQLMDKTLLDNTEHTNISELLCIISEQQQQIQKMAKHLAQINQLLNRQERRNICDHLNKTLLTNTPYSPFYEWIAHLEVSLPFILSMCQFDIRDTILERFKEYYYEKTSISSLLPIRAFIENKTKIYVYDKEKEDSSPKWTVFQNEFFGKLSNHIYTKWKRTFANWMIENADIFDTNHDMNEMKNAYMNKMDRYNHLSEKEKTSKLKQWLVSKIETNMPQIIMVYE